ncbi:hypothetical protein ACGFZH_03065 [Streptomyces zaomyceticus]|uniref:hypothetical protein n=1 Tax=Streptomyces zaomyceticus TaxID=68286 RepID=UPI00167AE51B|nr:hypothetical protein [Streptomyces zaomyceticus]GHG37154.1 hypothetical protein GCM10018791_63490 [Streptomyces zaomyceticus]
MQINKLLAVIVVVLLAVIVAFVAERMVSRYGAPKRVALPTSGAAFLGAAGLGMVILGYLTPS